MSRSLWSLGVLVLFALGSLTVTGCGGPSSTSRSSGTTTAGGIKKLAPSDLKTKIGEYMPPLEGGKLEMASPQGWHFTRAGDEYLVGFVPDGRELNKLPRILVSATDSPIAEISRVDEQNVKDFADRVAALHASEKLAERVRPLILGNNAFAHYVSMAKRRNAVVARQFLETIVSDRLYTVCLEVYDQQFAEHRDAAYALAASMKFQAGADDAALPDETAPAADAAAGKPAADAAKEPQGEPAPEAKAEAETPEADPKT